MANHDSQLKHSLKNRHIQMIALGGAIGTGLFLASGSAISLTGPSIVLAYILGGIIIYAVLRALGEMTVDRPTPGSFMEYARENVGEGAGFVVGWNTWMLFTVACMLEVGASATMLDYWFALPHWGVCLVLLSVMGGINLIGVKYFGETEFWFASIKIAVILFMIVTGTYFIFFDAPARTMAHDNIVNYTNMSVLFSHGIGGFMLSLVLVILSFGGSEFVGVAAGEAEDPTKSIPKAINGVVFRIILFYVLTIAIILLLYPYEQISAKTNPFTDVFSKIGLSKAAGLINFVAVTAALSSLNSCLYVASRFLFSLSNDKMAPRYFSKLSKARVPSYAVLFTVIMSFVVVIASYVFPEKLMKYLFSIATIGFLINWFMIMVSHLYFRKRKIKEGAKILYKMPGYPYINIIIMVVLVAVVVAMLQDKDMAMCVLVIPFWLGLLSVGYAVFKMVQKRTGAIREVECE